MKKILLPCFLALLCLFGSESRAQSRVVESPGTDILHRFEGPDRGGETRSTSLDIPAQEIDGGPWIAVRETNLSDSVATSQMVYLYGELVSDLPRDTVFLSTWTRFLDQSQQHPAPLIQRAPLVRGNLFEGSYGKLVFEFRFPATESVVNLSLRIDRNILLDNFLVQAGDSLKVLIDQKAGRLLFLGSSGKKYQAQQLINLSLEAERLDLDPVMVSSPSGKEKMILRYPEMFGQAQEHSSSVRKSLRFITDRQDSLFQVKSLAVQAPLEDPVWSLYESQKGVLGPVLAGIMPSRIIASQLLPFFRSARAYANLGEPVWHLAAAQAEFLWEIDRTYGLNADASELLDLLLRERYLMALCRETKLFAQFDQLAPSLRDRLYGKYITSTIEHRPISPEALDHALDVLETPWIADAVGEIKAHVVKGADLSGYSFEDSSGATLTLEQLEGKLVLVNFWLSGCIYSQAEFEKVLHPAEEYFKDDPRVVFLSVSADPKKESWQKTLAEGNFTSELSLPVYAGSDHPMIKAMGIHSYPRKVLLDTQGHLLGFQDLPRDPGALIQLLEQTLQTHSTTSLRKP